MPKTLDTSGLIRPDALAIRILAAFSALCLQLSYSLYRYKHRAGSLRSVQSILDRLASLQKDAARAGKILGAISPFVRKVIPAPSNRVAPPTVQLAGSDGEPPQWLSRLTGEIKARYADGRIDERTAKELIARLYKNAGLEVPELADIDLPVPEFVAPEGPFPQLFPLTTAASTAITSAETNLKATYTVLDQAASWLDANGLANISHFTRLADVSKVDQAIDLSSLMKELNSRLTDAIEKGLGPDDFAKTIEDLVQPPDHSVETLLRTQTKRSYLEGQNAVMDSPIVRRAMPYALYMATNDDRVRDSHWDADNVVVAVDDEESMDYLEELLKEYNCRCCRVLIDIEEAQNYQLYRIRNGKYQRISWKQAA